MNDLELHEFYENLVRTLRSKGVLCAITSGLACVHYGIAESTKDCNLLCHTSSFGTLLDLLAETKVEGAACRYRGNISPPLDARWHKGGWTSHFEWPGGAGALLDVFGSSSPRKTCLFSCSAIFISSVSFERSPTTSSFRSGRSFILSDAEFSDLKSCWVFI